MKKVIAVFLCLTLISTMFISACTIRNDIHSETAEIDKPITGYKYINNQNPDKTLTFGIVGDLNLFEPNADIPFWLTANDSTLNGKSAKITFSSAQNDIKQECNFTFEQSDGKEHTYTGVFRSCYNGVFSLKLFIEDKEEMSFEVGVCPKNQLASDDFYYGVNPYLSRLGSWGDSGSIKYQETDRAEKSLMDTIEWMGINLIRDDAVQWGSIQNSPDAPFNFTEQDKLIKTITDRGIKLNWIIGYIPNWAINSKYEAHKNDENAWTYYPDETYWDNYITAIGEHYKNNPNILYEIWNEPDWEFFTGTTEEYLSLLERTARILKQANPDNFVYSGGLALVQNPASRPPEPIFAKVKQLIDEGLLDTYGYHIHGPFSKEYFFKQINIIKSCAEATGLNLEGGINSESGCPGADASTIASRILYTRGHGYKGIAQFSFRQTPNAVATIDEYAIFNETLQPKEAVIAYSAIIHFLGQAKKMETISDKGSFFADIYFDGEKSIIPVFASDRGQRFTLPEGKDFKIFDMYGNQMKNKNVIIPRISPVYIIYDGLVTADMFNVKR